MAGLEDLYKEIVLDHYRSPRNRGELETPPAKHAEGFNPLCGDEVHVYVQIDDGIVTDVAIGGEGCSISQASASMMSAALAMACSVPVLMFFSFMVRVDATTNSTVSTPAAVARVRRWN